MAKHATRDSATERLITENLPLVRHAVSALSGRIPRSVDVGDLHSAGMMGLVQAAQAYDESRGIPFVRYARHRIEGALLDELRQRDWASRSVRAEARRLQAATERLAARSGRTPTTSETAQELGIEVGAVDRLREDLQRASLVHLEAMVGEDGQDAFVAGDEGPDGLLEQKELVGYLVDAVSLLPERLRVVVVGYFIEGRPMLDIAAELGVTDSRISQMRAEAIDLLREALVHNLETEQEPAAKGKLSAGAQRRRAAYCAAVATANDAKGRLEASDISRLRAAV